MRHFLARAIFVALLAGLVTPAEAQFPGGGTMRGKPDFGGKPPMREPPKPRPVDLVADTEYRLAMLQEDLRLRPDQEPAWIAYADRVRALAADISREQRRFRERRPVLVELELLVERTRNQLTALEDIVVAAKQLFAALTPQQQVIADPRFAILAAILVAPGAERPGAPSADGDARPR